MKTLYLECNMGAAGDMLTAALLELLEDRDTFVNQMNSLIPEMISVSAEPSEKCGVTGTHLHVRLFDGLEEETETGADPACDLHSSDHAHHMHDHAHHDHDHFHNHHDHVHLHDHPHETHDHKHHHHSGLSDIYSLIDGMELPEQVKTDAKAVYRIIAEAESSVHGKTMEQIHFHEVGTMDAVADVVGCCILMNQIGAGRVVVSPVHVGSGSVRCAHGLLPVPAPATALILRGVPIYGGAVQGELCTPTGAALLKYFATEFGSMPTMTVEKIGYGMGTKDFEHRPNCIRALLGYDDAAVEEKRGTETGEEDETAELCANLDDMTGEELGFAIETLLKEGALDVWCEPITMKKSRPAVKLLCLCRPYEQEKFAALILKHTTSIGVRSHLCRRFTLQRREVIRQTSWGPVSVKVCSGYGIEKEKAEFDELAAIAEKTNLSIGEIKKELLK